MFQMKELDKMLEKLPNEVEVSDLPDKKFKVMVIKMLTKLERRMDELGGLQKKKQEKEPAELKNTMTEMKSMLEGMADQRMQKNRSCLEDRAVESNQAEQQKEKNFLMIRC